MPDKKRLASLSIISILCWVFVLGLLLPSDDPMPRQNGNVIIVGTVVDIPLNGSGGLALQINDGERTWSCTLEEGVECPAKGDFIVAYCESRPGDTMLITRIGTP